MFLADAGCYVHLRVKVLKAVSAAHVPCLIIVAVVPTVSTSVNDRQRINVSDTHSTPGVQAKI